MEASGESQNFKLGNRRSLTPAPWGSGASPQLAGARANRGLAGAARPSSMATCKVAAPLQDAILHHYLWRRCRGAPLDNSPPSF